MSNRRYFEEYIEGVHCVVDEKTNAVLEPGCPSFPNGCYRKVERYDSKGNKVDWEPKCENLVECDECRCLVCIWVKVEKYESKDIDWSESICPRCNRFPYGSCEEGAVFEYEEAYKLWLKEVDKKK